MQRPQIHIRKFPPAFGQPEGQIDPSLTCSALHQNHEPARGKKSLDIAHGLAQIARGMQHVGGNHHVELVRSESLCPWIALNIHQLIADKRVIAKLLGGPFQEQRRDIGKDIFAILRPKRGQDKPRCATGACAKFQDAQRAVFGHIRNNRCHGCFYKPVHRPH